MTAEEIRAAKNECDDGLWQCAEWLKEIAAQLADHNAEAAKYHAAQTSFQEGVARVQSSLGNTLETMSKPASAPRVVFPAEVVHLGCLVREPDGTHILACEAGRVQLEPDVAQTLLGLMSLQRAEAEAKPS